MAERVEEKYFELFEQVGKHRHYSTDEHITREGQIADNIYLITSGRAIVYHITESGKQMTFDVLKQGTLLGDSSFMRNGVQNYNIKAVTDVDIIFCNTKKLISVLKEHEGLLVLLLELMTSENHQLSNQIVRLAYYSSEQKIAAYILDMSAKNKSIPFTHNDIALGTGLNRVTVSRAMKSFKEKGLIDYSYGIITIEDRNGLKQIVPETN